MFHLPHNAIVPDEVEFIINLIDEKKEYYLYDELKAMLFEEEIRQGVFSTFHTGMYDNYMHSPALKSVYEKILNRECSYSDIKSKPYTDNKTINGVWNEIVRDYFEFLAFTGLMPSYYKSNPQESEKRYYVGETLRLYKAGKLSYSDILFRMKHRNASKDFSSFSQQYDIRNRPFVVALKVLDKFKKSGYEKISGRTISYYVKTIKNEDDIDNYEFLPINKSDFSGAEYKEIGRGTTFLRQHLKKIGVIDLAKSARGVCVFDLKHFDISNYKFHDKSVYIGDVYETSFGNFELTPFVLQSIANPSKITDNDLKLALKELNLIDDEKALCDFNIDTDLMSRNEVELFKTQALQYSTVEADVSNVELTEEYRIGKAISEGSNGTDYEKFLWNLLKNKFGKQNVVWYGSQTTGQRLSDITCDVKILDINGTPATIKLIIESKAGAAIKAFDERKEIVDIENTIKLCNIKKYDGIWYIIVDSNKIPSANGHGGFRASANQKSFKNKLLTIHSTLLSQLWKPTLVTAFSYNKFMKFLYQIDYERNCVCRMQTPDFWTWSDSFIRDSYVTIVA